MTAQQLLQLTEHGIHRTPQMRVTPFTCAAAFTATLAPNTDPEIDKQGGVHSLGRLQLGGLASALSKHFFPATQFCIHAGVQSGGSSVGRLLYSW